MKKKIWVLAWLLAMAAAFGLYIQTVIAEAGRPPAPGWSRPLTVDSMTGLSAYELRSNEGITSVLMAGGVRIIYQNPHQGLLAADVDNSGIMTGKRTLAADFKPADKLIAYQKNGEWLLAALQDDTLNRYLLDGNVLTFSSSDSVNGIRNFDRADGRELLLTDDAVILRAENGETILTGDYLKARWIPSTSPLACLIQEQNGRKLLQIAEPSSGSAARILKEWTLPADAQTAVESLTPYGDDKTTGALVELKDFKTGMVHVVDFRLAPITQEKGIASGRSDLNPIALDVQDGELRLLLTQEQRKGDDEVVWNICQSTWNGSQLTPQGYKTRTNAVSVPIAGWATGGWHYVLSADISGDTKKLLLSGDSPMLMAQTAAISREEYATLLPGAMMTLLPAAMVGLFPLVYILLPIMTVLFMVSVFRLNWAESHAPQLIRFALGGHLLMKGIFAYGQVLYNSSIPDISTQLPWYLNTLASMSLTLMISTAIAWWIAQLRNPSRSPGDFSGPYAQFALIDLSIFIVLVMPYYYAYVGLPVFFR